MGMDNTIFQIEFNQWLVEVKVIDKEKSIFNIHFLNEIPDMLIQKTTTYNGDTIWRSTIYKMESMAQYIGVLIEQYYKHKLLT